MANDLFEENFEAGSNGAALTTGNTSVTIIENSGAAVTFTNSPVHEGSLAMNVAASANYGAARWDSLGSLTNAWVVFRIYFTALPSALVYLTKFFDTGVGHVSDVRMNTNGTLTIRNDAQVAAATTTTPLQANVWNRVAIRCQPNTVGGLVIKTYVGANVDGTTPTETVQGNHNLSEVIDKISVGVVFGTPTWTATFDLVEGSSTAEPLPSVSDTVDPVAVVSHVATDATFNSSNELTSATFDVTAAASTDNIGVTGYSWSDNAAGGSFSSTTVAAPTWTPPDLVSGPWTLTCTVSDAAANTNSAGVVVDVDGIQGGSGSPVAGLMAGKSGAAI